MGVQKAKSGTHLVRVLEQDVLALRLLEAEVGDGADDSPSVGEVDVHLRRKVSWLVPLGAEDRVARGIARVDTRNVSERRRVGGQHLAA